jgi:hypothetical protein
MLPLQEERADGSLVSRGGREVVGRGSSHGGLPVLVVANLDLSPFLSQKKCFGAGGRTNLGPDQIIVTRARLCALDEQDQLSRRRVGALFSVLAAVPFRMRRTSHHAQYLAAAYGGATRKPEMAVQP